MPVIRTLFALEADMTNICADPLSIVCPAPAPCMVKFVFVIVRVLEPQFVSVHVGMTIISPEDAAVYAFDTAE